MKRRRKLVIAVLVLTPVCVLFAVGYVRWHPLVFNESLWEHAHCMPQATLSLLTYASDNGGRFPSNTNGYGDALLLATNYIAGAWGSFTGPGYDAKVFAEAARTGRHIPEKACGRVYVQGLSQTNDPRIAMLFDKVAAPPDHCQFPRRLWAGFFREVGFVDGSWRPVSVGQWPSFAKEQIDLLVQAGFSRDHAEQLYAGFK